VYAGVSGCSVAGAGFEGGGVVCTAKFFLDGGGGGRDGDADVHGWAAGDRGLGQPPPGGGCPRSGIGVRITRFIVRFTPPPAETPLSPSQFSTKTARLRHKNAEFASATQTARQTFPVTAFRRYCRGSIKKPTKPLSGQAKAAYVVGGALR
jgi:hypothetical protein